MQEIPSLSLYVLENKTQKVLRKCAEGNIPLCMLEKMHFGTQSHQVF